MNTKETSQASSGGIGLFTLLTVLFVALKLTGYITWSWWWVLVLVWAPLALVMAVLLFMAIIWAITLLAESRARR